MATYIALLRKDPASDFGVDFPDFPGCITAASTMEKACPLAKEALQLHIDGMLEDGDDIPEPSSLQSIMADPDSRGAAAFLVDVDVPTDRVRRINITVPERDLRVIDELAAEHAAGNRSRFLIAASRYYREQHGGTRAASSNRVVAKKVLAKKSGKSQAKSARKRA